MDEKLKNRVAWEGDLVFRGPHGKMLDTSHVSAYVLRPLLEAAGVRTEGMHDFAKRQPRGEKPAVEGLG
jgi:hypothetical protein